MRQNNRKEKNYEDAVREVLIMFQLLEEGLKIYLDKVFFAIKTHMRPKLVCKYTRKDIDNCSLGSLIKLFKKYNDNKPLQKNLNEVCEERNFYAHKGFLLWKYKQRLSENDIIYKIKECLDVASKTSKLNKQIQEEIEKLEKDYPYPTESIQ